MDRPDTSGTAAAFTRDWGLLGGQTVKLSTNPLVFAFRSLMGLISIAVLAVGLGLLLFGLWPATLVLAIIAAALFPRKDWRKAAAVPGAWEGSCPSCRKSVVVADPQMQAVLAPISAVCPHCRTGLSVSKDRFDAIP